MSVSSMSRLAYLNRNFASSLGGMLKSFNTVSIHPMAVDISL